MTLRFAMLASGSAGNACLVQSSGPGLLVDMGLQPGPLEERLRMLGQIPHSIAGVLLTHTHSDHWNDASLSWLARQGIPFYCHLSHRIALEKNAAGFARLQMLNLVHYFEPEREFLVKDHLRCRPFLVRHDGSGETFGFRIEGPRDLIGRSAAVGYVSDLGCWDESVVAGLAEVDLLAVEFNHDEQLQRASGRPAFLIARVLGNSGHLSNDQAAALVQAVMLRSTPGRLQHLVLLHLSGDCNRPALAKKTARDAVERFGFRVRIHPAEQHQPGPFLRLEPGVLAPTIQEKRVKGTNSAPREVEPWLPGLEEPLSEM